MEYVGPISLIVLIPLGVALLWSVSLAYRARGLSVDDPLRLVLTFSGWTLIILGLMGAVTHLLVVAAPIGWLIVLAVIAMAVARYRVLERRALLWSFSIAASKGIPLEQAARAFSDERTDEIGVRASRLADLLESGVPLTDALAASRTWLPTDALVAVRVGQETGQLAPALAQVVKMDDDMDSLLRSVFEKFVYLGLIVNVLIGILMFLMLKIVPVFRKMFEDFELELPPMTQWVVETSQFGVSYWFLMFPFILVLMMLFFVGALYYTGWLPRDIPGLNRLALRFDGAVVMRVLALAVRQDISLPRMIGLLTDVYPRWSMRARLLAAAARIEGGHDWCESLLYAGIIRRYDAAVLKTATRVGNLAWALEEMAESAVRRMAYRLRLLLNVAFPLVLVAFGIVVAFHVIGLFMPLVSLIQGLT
ncbi:MAG: type II secretion system F family protein [Pirellulaceae bacterium]